MKITTVSETPAISSIQSGLGSARDATSSGESTPAARTSLSSDAAFVQALRDESGGIDGIRPDVVAEARAEIAAGTLGDNIDVEQMIDALLADL